MRFRECGCQLEEFSSYVAKCAAVLHVPTRRLQLANDGAFIFQRQQSGGSSVSQLAY
jgi:hypothetical protein